MFLKSIFVFSVSLVIGTTVPDNDDDTSFLSEIHDMRTLNEPEDVSFLDEVFQQPGMTWAPARKDEAEDATFLDGLHYQSGMTIAQPKQDEADDTSFLDEVFNQPGMTLKAQSRQEEAEETSFLEEVNNRAGMTLEEPEEDENASFGLSTPTVEGADKTASDPIELPEEGLVLREPTPDDMGPLLYLEAVSFTFDLPDWYIPYIEGKPELVRVAQIGDAVVGMVLLMLIHDQPEVLYIGNLAVLPEYRRLGIGSALLDWAAEFGKVNGFTALALHVHTGNPNAQSLYLKHGFAVIDLTEEYYTQLDPQSAFTMMRQL